MLIELQLHPVTAILENLATFAAWWAWLLNHHVMMEGSVFDDLYFIFLFLQLMTENVF